MTLKVQAKRTTMAIESDKASKLMLTVAEVREKARTRLRLKRSTWATQDGPIRDIKSQSHVFSEIKFDLRPPSEQEALKDQQAAVDWVASWRKIGGPNAEDPGPGKPIIDWVERSWSRIGRQHVPRRMRLRTPDAVAEFVGGEDARQWHLLRGRIMVIRGRFNNEYTATSAIKAHSAKILQLDQAEFETVLSAVAWLRDNPVGTIRPRQMPIRGVDSKWFEKHRKMVESFLDAIERSDAVDVLDAEPRARMRILDHALVPFPLSDINAPLAELSALNIAPRLVFVFENLESVLSMPVWAGAVAVHGSGYVVNNVARLAWTHEARVIYWGDLDSHGMAILAQLRRQLPQVESVLMAEDILIEHKDLWVQELEPIPHSRDLPELTETETQALARIRAEGDVRLEQERIPWETALERLAASAGEPE